MAFVSEQACFYLDFHWNLAAYGSFLLRLYHTKGTMCTSPVDAIVSVDQYQLNIFNVSLGISHYAIGIMVCDASNIIT